MKRWYATEPMGMAGTGAHARLVLATSPCGSVIWAGFGTGVKVRTQHAIPANGRPMGLGGVSPG